MEVFKFGGASVKDGRGVKNVAKILTGQGVAGKVVVISAMGKTTNAVERVVNAYFEEKATVVQPINRVRDFHDAICSDLFSEDHVIFEKIHDFIEALKSFLDHNTSTDYDYVYDQIVPFGELLSTSIVSAYLAHLDIKHTFKDARALIKTDAAYRTARVDWQISEKQISKTIARDGLTLTQGFIAGHKNSSDSTTLGREGSDYTAGILAYCLNADQVSIWKNVKGVLNADPREFSDTTLLEHISYQEAIELAFYGASVIHPKTLQPLQRKEIPLFVKSFADPGLKGTSVGKWKDIFPDIPCFIVKKKLILLSLSTRDFSFFVEDSISEVFAFFHNYQTKVHLIQNSAISFSVCVTDQFKAIHELIAELQTRYKVSYNTDVTLFTIRHFDKEAIDKIRRHKTVLLEQRTRETVQLVTR